MHAHPALLLSPTNAIKLFHCCMRVLSSYLAINVIFAPTAVPRMTVELANAAPAALVMQSRHLTPKSALSSIIRLHCSFCS